MNNLEFQFQNGSDTQLWFRIHAVSVRLILGGGSQTSKSNCQHGIR